MVVSIPVQEGQMVQKGDVLVIRGIDENANELRSPRDGKVIRVRVEAGDRVETERDHAECSLKRMLYER